MLLHQTLQKFRAVFASSDLRFLLMFVGVIIAPYIIFLGGGADTSGQNRANLFWEFMTLGVLFLATLSLGWAMFKHKARSLSIFTPLAAKLVAHKAGA